MNDRVIIESWAQIVWPIFGLLLLWFIWYFIVCNIKDILAIVITLGITILVISGPWIAILFICITGPALFHINKKLIDGKIDSMWYIHCSNSSDIIHKEYRFYDVGELLIQEQILAGNPKIKAINIPGSYIKKRVLRSIIRNPLIIAIRFCRPLSSNIIDALCDNPGIKYLEFGFIGKKNNTIKFASYLRGSSIKFCYMVDHYYNDEQYDYILRKGIVKARKLKYLVIKNSLKPELIQILLKSNVIKRLEITCRELSLKAAKILKENKSLTYLKIRCQISDDCLLHIIKNTSLYKLMVPYVYSEDILIHNYRFKYWYACTGIIFSEEYGYVPGMCNKLISNYRRVIERPMFDLL